MPLGTWFGKPRCLTLSLPGKAGLTASQINDWLAYDQIEPFGEMRNELRHGQQMALHLNLNRDSKQRSEPFTALECMNYVVKPPEKIYTVEELEAYADKIFGK